jgi:hypothetical protein
MALTRNEFLLHVGRFTTQGISNSLSNDELLQGERMRLILSWAKDHVSDSDFSNIADRKEAAYTFLKEVFERTWNRNVDANQTNRRIFRKWIDSNLGYGEGINFEPGGV